MNFKPCPAWLAIPILIAAAHPPCSAQDTPTAEQLIRELGCSNCHTGLAIAADVQEKAPDLSDAGMRYNPSYLFGFLQFPTRVRQNIGTSRMPNFHLRPEESLALTLYLQTLVPEGAETPDFMLDPRYREARAAHPDVSAETGRRMFLALNCRACHRQTSLTTPVRKIAPDLSGIGAKVRRAWLSAFLQEPGAVRPFGFRPGSGNRMPNFRLTPAEAEVLTDYLMRQKGDFADADTAYTPKILSPFSMAKAKTYIRTKLSCLGCHQLGGEGGRIGPDLSDLKRRLQPGFVYRMVRDPARVLGEIIMPKTAMTEERRLLVTNFLVQQEEPRSEAPYLSLVEHAPAPYSADNSPKVLYERHCAQCHGPTGGGDGYNAAFLPVKPTVHSDAAAMAQRPDDTLFDGIHAGAYILNKSNRMPPWGHSLSYEQIRQLVAYIRQLCACQGPAWSRDDQQRPRQ